jgi:tetratricopeptide (TPR) repeat protein
VKTLNAISAGAGCCMLLGLGCAPLPPRPGQATPPRQATMTSPEIWFTRGITLAARGDGSRAEQYLMLAVRQGYPEARAIVPLVQVCIASSRLRAALDHAEPFLRRHPSAWRLRYLLATIRLALGDAPAAAKELTRVLAQRPGEAQPRYLLGVIERDAFGDEAAARRDFGAYVELAPRGAHAAETRAWLAEHPEPSARLAADEAREATP